MQAHLGPSRSGRSTGWSLHYQFVFSLHLPCQSFAAGPAGAVDGAVLAPGAPADVGSSGPLLQVSTIPEKRSAAKLQKRPHIL